MIYSRPNSRYVTITEFNIQSSCSSFISHHLTSLFNLSQHLKTVIHDLIQNKYKLSLNEPSHFVHVRDLGSNNSEFVMTHITLKKAGSAVMLSRLTGLADIGRCSYSRQINRVSRYRKVCLSYLKHIIFKHLRTYLLQILDMIITKHHDKPNETCHCVYSKDVFFEDVVHYLLYKNLWNIYLLLVSLF